jgi:hypothetical protein
MPMTRYASFESAKVLDVRGSREKQKTASLDKFADYGDFRTHDGYLYARIRAISSRVNKNHDGWPAIELAGSSDIFDQHTSSEGFTVEASKDRKHGFSTFLGKPIFVDHNNSDPKRARGVIVDAKFHVEDSKTSSMDPYYSSDDVDPDHLPAAWVELLLEVDADKFPRLAKAIIDGSKDSATGIDGFSMGCDVDHTICNICSNKATAPDEFCDHIRLKGALFDYTDPKTGHRVAKKSYENCYGIKFFEISAVFDPADETALIRELIHKEAAAPLVRGMKCPECLGVGMDETGAPCPACGGTGEMRVGQGHDGDVYSPQRGDYDQLPAKFPSVNQPGVGARGVGTQRNDPYMSKQADNPKPQSENITAPEEVDTLRQEKVCPVCGADIDSEKCDVCGYIDPPDGLNTPDLTKHQDMKEELDPMADPVEAPPVEEPASPLEARNDAAPGPVTSSMSNFTPRVHPRLAGRINVIEKPIKPGSAPATDEPQETVIRDESKPVTSRSAAGLIEAAGQTQTQENSMANDPRVAAEPADPSGKPDKRIPVDGVGGFMDANAEAASAPDKRIDPTGKGGFMDADNASASKPDEKQSIEGGDGDNAGFNHDKTTDDSGPTKTFPNNGTRAVTDQAFPTAAVQGVKPIGGPDVQPQRREDVESDAGWNNPGTQTDQWTGTGGNGVTRQQDPVTNVPTQSGGGKASGITSHIVNVMKLADTEIDLGMIHQDAKYARIAELEREDEAVIAARLDTLKRVRTAGLKRQPSVSRLPSFRTASTVEDTNTDDKLDDPRYESALFGV